MDSEITSAISTALIADRGREMTTEELKRRLAAHAAWLDDPKTGERLVMIGSDLRGADLSGSDLRWADLRWAILFEVKRIGWRI